MLETTAVPGFPDTPPAVPTPLSAAQRRQWFLNDLTGGNGVTVSVAVTLAGDLDTGALRRALADVVARHDVLRTVYIGREGVPAAVPLEPALACPELGVVPVVEEELGALLAATARGGYDLERDRPLWAGLYRLAEDEHVLQLVLPGIAADERSADIVLRDLALAYSARTEGDQPEWPALPVRFADFAAWQERTFGPDGEPTALAGRQLDYWVNALDGMPSGIELPVDRPRAAGASLRSDRVEVRLDPGTLAAAGALGEHAGGDLAAVLRCAFAVTLRGFGAGGEIPVGSTADDRARREFDALAGPFADPRVLRVDADGSVPFAELVTRSAKADRTARSNAGVPFERVVAAAGAERSASRHPLCQVTVDVHPAAAPPPFDGLEVTPRPVPGGRSPFDLSLRLDPDGHCGLSYSAALFDESTAHRIAAAFTRVLTAAVAEPDVPAGRLPVASAAELRELLHDRNDTARPVQETGVAEDFAARVRSAPDAVALVCGADEFTYAELDARANRLARLLLRGGAGPETFVALVLPRTEQLVTALLAVAKTGAAYLPVDPEYPADRIGYMLDHTAPAIVLAAEATVDAVPGSGERTIIVDAPGTGTELSTLDDSAIEPGELAAPVHGGNAAYVIYTSGSTGLPKGVVVSRRALANFLADMTDRAGLHAGDRLLAVTTIAFDIAALEIYLPLRTGAAVVLADRDAVRDPAALGALARSAGITVMQATPSLWQAVCVEAPDAVRGLRMLVGGEALPAAQARRMRELGGSVTNVYGPTETTIWSTAAVLTEDTTTPPIGGPIRNTGVYVLDAALRPVPAGVAGELYLTGAGLARGYLGRPGITAERFLAAPFGAPGTRMYRTGDLARWNTAGTLDFLGRSDHQVKIRGFRVELGEIETALERHPGVARAVVIAREDRPGDVRLAGYLVPAAGPVEHRDVLAHLASGVPDYMVPAALVTLDELPMTANRKVDRSALPAPRFAADGSGRAPRTTREELLCDLFAEVLGVVRVGIDDGFFDLGGHSLLAMRLLGRIRTVLGHALPIRALFDTPTPAGLAAALTGEAADGDPIGRGPEAGPWPLSAEQRRMWFLHEFEPTGTEYNSSVAVRLHGSLDVDAVRRALDALATRHESLRTTFDTVDGQGVQIVHPPGPVPLRRRDLCSLPEPERAGVLYAALADEIREPFVLREGPLLRPLLVRTAEADHVLLLGMHHIVTDGWSKNILIREFCALYAQACGGPAAELEPLPLRYRDYAHWQAAELTRPAAANERAYWKRVLDGVAPLELPTDRPRPAERTSNGAVASFAIPAEVTAGLTALGTAHGGTLFSTLVAAVQVLFARYSRQSDIAVGTVVSGRSRPELENLAGFFVNTLVLRSRVPGDRGFTDLLVDVRETVLDAFSHQGVPFDELVDAVQPERDPSRTPLVQAAVVLQNTRGSYGEHGGVTMTEHELPRLSALFDLGFEFTERDGELSGRIEYNTDLFDADTARRMAEHLLVLLDGIVADPARPVAELPLLSAAERELVVTGFNDTAMPYELDTVVPRLIAARADDRPGAVAIGSAEGTTTFAELEERANRLAHLLIRHGVRPREVVGLRTTRCGDMAVGLLAIMKTGAAYVAVDPSMPPGRAAFVVGDSGARIVLTQRRFAGSLAEAADAGATLLCLDELGPELARMPASRPEPGIGPDDLAYVVYTSGSTGTPKGVEVTHRGVLNLATWYREYYSITGADRGTQVVPQGFDPIVLELWCNLAAGASVWIASDEMLADPAALAEWIAGTGITMAVIPAPRLESLLAQPRLYESSLRYLMTGADVVRRRVGRHAPFTMVNHYGPSEITVLTTGTPMLCIEDAEEGKLPSIGSAIANHQAYVLDERREPVPIGVPGEAYIGGAGLARGYLNRPELTAERFVRNPFSEDPGSRLYRTGDLVRWLPDGTLDFLGRIDNQVKIRGNRVELGEIETALSRHESVGEAAVTTRTRRPGQHELIGYVVPAGPHGCTVDALRDFLAAELPAYMVPSVFVVLPEFPRTASDKIDRRTLPVPSAQAPAGPEPVAPANATEQALAEVWAEVLGVGRIGVEDNFFDIGGNSVLSLQVVSRVREMFDVALSAREVFRAPTIRAMADQVREQILAEYDGAGASAGRGRDARGER
ncbi:non-ribosomal peptide synthetase [Amycolatopsis antarctica]|uniref:Non-ribosomal peptide synthetase n=1 Tax=Amycolatopsis antarctica TaxID=1854586 RepID=A0A263D7Y1_9PSEU|nr:non-ribosomal peptide synthetase [Amycolatopsis antarctica]OZM73586.1 non-ribosomal peptide synthetase [Amycolatopsis antarctica]